MIVLLDDLLWWVGTTAVVVVAVLLAHMLMWRVVMRVLRGRQIAADLRRHCYRSSWGLAAIIVLMPLVRTSPLDPDLRGWVFHGLLIGLIGAVGWLTTRLLVVASDTYVRRTDLDDRPDPWSRRRRTQVDILQRIVVTTIMVLAGAVALLTFEAARTVGTSLLASAGIAAAVAGVAARSTIANLTAGLQIAFSEQIKLDDVVVVEGEWGTIEEITLSHVVVRIWDKRRLVLPTIYFTDQPFENWTRSSSDVLGTVFLYADYTVPVEPIRQELARIVEASPLWDGQRQSLLVTNLSERTVELRAVVSAHNSSNIWELRCEVRERLLGFLQREFPEALPRVRAELQPLHDNGARKEIVGSNAEPAPDRAANT